MQLKQETQPCLSSEFSCEPLFRKGLGEEARVVGFDAGRGVNHLSASLTSPKVDLETREGRVPCLKPHS